MKNVTIAGSGVLGSQIAFHVAFHGYAVQVYDINDEALDRARASFVKLAATYLSQAGASDESTQAALGRITLTCDLEKALADSDIVIESVPENVELKVEFYKQAGALAPAKTIFATNTSTLLPSQFADASGRPERFLALHFANELWLRNIAEIMRHTGTSAQVFAETVAFAKSIGMIALPLHKEQPGYITNSLIVPWVTSALRMWVDGVADFETIDKTWMIGAKSTFAPFVISDVVGLNTAYNVALSVGEQQGDALLLKAAQRLKDEFIDQGKLGVSTGEGFYRYPNPAFMAEDFLG